MPVKLDEIEGETWFIPITLNSKGNDMIEVITEGVKGNVVALAAHGKVDHNDYEKVLIPVLEEKIKVHGKVRLLYRLGEDFTSYTVGAIWDDAKVGIRHLTAVEKAAVVTNVTWVRDSVAFFRFLIPCPFKLFRNDEFSAAMAWINE